MSSAISPDLAPEMPTGADLEGSRTPTVAAEDRGRLEIADRVVEKVAGHAVTLVPDASAAPRRVLGVNVGDVREEGRAEVDAQVHGGLATVQAWIAVRWPRSVPEVADAVQHRVRDEVRRITGVQVDHVDVEITAMTSGSANQRRVR